jgi:hypothetical protein
MVKAEDGAGGGGDVAEVAAVAGANVGGGGKDAVGGVETFPADVGDVKLNPGVGGVAAGAGGAGVAGVDVAADVTGGDAEQAGEVDEEVGEILADALL